MAKHLPKFKLANILTVVVVLVALVSLGLLFGEQQSRISTQSARLQSAHAENVKLLNDYTKSIDDCNRSSDCTSTVPAPKTIIEQGTPGPSGQNGQNATDDQVARQVDIYCDIRVECEGPPGVDGTDGVNGTDGATGPQGPQGDTGPAGQAGADGTNGTNGADGQPPVSWTYTDDLGITHTCTRTDPFDPTAPTYTCS